jgi:hypothetical protein
MTTVGVPSRSSMHKPAIGNTGFSTPMPRRIWIVVVRRAFPRLQNHRQPPCRSSLAGVVDWRKNFLRYLHFSRATPTDLSAALRAPRIYMAGRIPSALGAEEVREVLQLDMLVALSNEASDCANP